MRIVVVGTGYVGLVSGACFAKMGNVVHCIDINAQKIQALKQGNIPIYEPGLDDLVQDGLASDTLHFGTDLKAVITDTEIIFIAVGTPMGEDGSADLQYVMTVAEQIGDCLTKHLVVVDKSTVPVGTGAKVEAIIRERLALRGEAIDFDVVSNPEFLKEGAAVDDFMHPDRVIIGANNQRAKEIMQELYKPFVLNHERFVTMDIVLAEMTKYAANAMLATKISFINEIARICEHVGADVNMVRAGIGSDNRIGYSFIYPGAGYGGSCFPKDVRALQKTAHDYGYYPLILKAVEETNTEQKRLIPSRVLEKFGSDLAGKTIAVWGLAFKPETDDMREASSLTLIRTLVQAGARVKTYDPKAMVEAKVHYFADLTAVEYCNDKYEALVDADALVLMTEWKEFRSPDFDRIKNTLKTPIIFDGRNQYSYEKLKKAGFEYYQIGKGW